VTIGEIATKPLAPCRKRRPFRDGSPHITEHPIQLLLRDDRPHLDVWIEAIANAQGLRVCRQALDELFVDAALNEQPCSSCSDLAAVVEHSHRGARRSKIKV